ncbi:MAG: MerC domain-containing protein [Novosphingobium sp.]|nr:MerC domain-containing protein [Novosphingobium sp.]
MRATLSLIRNRMDRFGIALSGLCLVHCVAGIFLVAMLGLGGSWLLDPTFHRVGLSLAVAIGVLTIGLGVMRHRQIAPLIVAAIGLTFMVAGILVEHGPWEAGLTIPGVIGVAIAHVMNLRHA